MTSSTPLMNGSPDMGQAALWYARNGIPVFPLHNPSRRACSCSNPDCDSVGKHPRTPHGYKDATTDPQCVSNWWSIWPKANIGIPTGEESGVLVVDVDPRNGGPSDREEIIRRLGPISETAEVLSGGGGRHLYFRYPGGPAPKELIKGVDLKGAGGYVVAPPSIHLSGKRYEVDGLSGAKAFLNIAEIPEWLRERISTPTNGTYKTGEQDGSKWPKGERNNRLASVAGTMRRRGMSREAITAGLLEENRLRCEPPLPEDEVRRIAESVARYEPADESKQRAAHERAAGVGALVTRCLAEIEPKPVSWLWPGRIPRGKSTLIAGDPGLGKSQITASIAAVVTTGGQWPVTREQCEPGDVLFLTAEDDAADTLWPRLEAAGADRNRIHVVEAVVVGYTGDGSQQQRTFSLEKDLRALETRLTELGNVAAVVIDPITAYLGSIDSHRNAEVRGLLAPLSAMIARHNVALIAVSHLSKAVGPKALMRVNGSGAFGAIPRGAYLVTLDPADKNRRLFLPMKNNLGKEIDGLAFRIEGVTVASPAGPLETSRVMWEQGPVTITADEAMQADTPEGSGNAVAETADWLREILIDGPIPSSEIFKRGDAEGFSKRTLKRAASKLGIKPAKSGMSGGWSWSLPPKSAKTPEECQQKDLAPFGEFGTLRGLQDAEVEL